MRKKYYPLLITACLFVLLFWISVSVPKQTIENLIGSAGIFAPLVYIFLILLTFIIAPLSGSPIVFAGFYIFGHKVVFLNLVASTISTVVNFWVARIWGRNLVRKFVGENNINRIDELARNYGLTVLIVSRIFQGSIHDFVSFAAGLTEIKFWPYFIISVLVSIPGTLLWYLVALQVDTPVQFIILIWVIALSFSLIFVLGRRVLKGKAN